MISMVYVGNSVKGGISAFALNTDGGTLEERGAYMGDKGIAPLAMHPNGRVLYAAVRSDPPTVAAFAVDGASGELVFINEVEVPVVAHYMTVDGGGRFLLAASYGGNRVYVMPLGRGGVPQPEPVCVLRPGRNPHCIVLDGSNRFAYVPVLGSDIVAQYRFDSNTGMLTPNSPPFAASAREAGPRHMILSPDNRFAYMLTEMGGEVGVYGVDRDGGALTPMHSVSVLPPERALPKGGYTPPSNATGGPNSPAPVMWCAEIRMTPDAGYLYVSERTGSTISCFRVDPVSGRLDLTGVTDTEERPRGFALDFFGKFLVAAGERSGHVSVYRVGGDGGLGLSDRKAVGSGPTWVETALL